LEHSISTSVGKPIRIMERSVFSERFCFLENQLALGKIEKVEYLILEKWFNLIRKEFEMIIKPDVISKIKKI